MKTNLNQIAYGRGSDTRQNHAVSGASHQIPAVSPPERHVSWFSNYDEEWAAFVNEHSISKTRPGINNEEPEPLPRVWNCPRF